MDPTVRELVASGGSVQEVRDPTAKPVDLAIVEEGDRLAAEQPRRLALEPLEQRMRVLTVALDARQRAGLEKRKAELLAERDCIVREELSFCSQAFASSWSAHSHLGIWPIWRAGTRW